MHPQDEQVQQYIKKTYKHERGMCQIGQRLLIPTGKIVEV